MLWSRDDVWGLIERKKRLSVKQSDCWCVSDYLWEECSGMRMNFWNNFEYHMGPRQEKWNSLIWGFLCYFTQYTHTHTQTRSDENESVGNLRPILEVLNGSTVYYTNLLIMLMMPFNDFPSWKYSNLKYIRLPGIVPSHLMDSTWSKQSLLFLGDSYTRVL